ncbi:leucine-rich repeat domain-containing protein [Ectobacillus antri]|jgi:hypothetical protein|uniref:leucine-rich repeat domain-containing protein n=1 Tax=Ectobacillus antri TaxID=2486280 RepID=UPI000F59B7C7|nr:leucine-rich repeat domain-containing protein [Ectobacillus antri]
MNEFEILSPDRVHIHENISEDSIQKIAMNLEVKFVQIACELSQGTWDLLNKIVFKERKDITLRLYGDYLDVSFLRFLYEVQHIAIDLSEEPRGLEYLAVLRQLKSLHFHIFEIENFDALHEVSIDLESLGIGETRSKKPTLKPIERFKQLKDLGVVGHQKHIEALANLIHLQKLMLTSVTTPNLEYVERLRNLQSLCISFGGIHNFKAIEGMSNIKHLDLYQIRKLQDLSFISHLTGLQTLTLGALPNVTELPSLQDLRYLYKIELENMKGLKNLDSLEFAPALCEFYHSSAQNMQPEDYIPLLSNKNVKKVGCGFGSIKRNDAFKQLANEFHKFAY